MEGVAEDAGTLVIFKGIKKYKKQFYAFVTS
jgi:hypothetical protein